MKVRQLRKVHQISMLGYVRFPAGAPGTLLRQFQEQIEPERFAKPQEVLPPVASLFKVVRAKDGVEVAVLDSLEEANALIEKHVRQKKAKLVLQDEASAVA